MNLGVRTFLLFLFLLTKVHGQLVTPSVCLYGLQDFPLVKTGDCIGEHICAHIKKSGFELEDHDVIVIAQKIISIAEGALVHLKEVVPTLEAKKLSESSGRDERLCQVIIDESREIIEVKGKIIVTRHKIGFRGTNAGVDSFNIAESEAEIVAVLPNDSDKSAQEIRKCIYKEFGIQVAVIISDSCGEPAREGSKGAAIGIAGMEPLRKEEGKDLYGKIKTSFINRVDEIAGAASAVMGQIEGIPVVVGRGFNYRVDENASIYPLLGIKPLAEVISVPALTQEVY